MWPLSNRGPLAHESGALPTELRGLAVDIEKMVIIHVQNKPDRVRWRYISSHVHK